MKKIITLSAITALIATSAFATNGTNLIGYGAKSRAMGGTGVAQFQGAESGFNNPALIGMSDKNYELTIGGTILMPDVTYSDNTSGTMTTVDSTSEAGIIPDVGVINKVNDQFAWGLTMYGTGGMGVDYRDSTGTMAGTTGANNNLMTMRFTVPLAYTPIKGLSLGFAPVIEYGSLSMAGSGTAANIAYGFDVGAAYKWRGLTVGVDYKSEIEHDYKNTFNSDFTGGTQSKLSSPAIVATGLSYQMPLNAVSTLTAAIEYKMIMNSSASGFEDFGWEDQNVYALGLEYANKSGGYAVRVGFNYGENPLENDAMVNPNGSLGSIMTFPAVTEQHYTFGASKSINNRIDIDLAYVYGTGSEDWKNGAVPNGLGGYVPVDASTTNDQHSLTVAVNYKFN